MSAADVDVAVLGAGPAGAGAAWRLALSGRRVVLLERNDGPGGAAASAEVAGQRVDLGSHRLHPSTPPTILAELRGLIGDDLQVRPRRGRIRLAGRWLAFPLQPLDLVRRLPPSVAAGAVRDVLTRRPPATEDTFASVLLAGVGPTLCERFWFPYARKVWGLAPEELSGEQARRRVATGTSGALVRRVLAGNRGERGSFLYPRRGFGQLWEAVAGAAVAAGADVRYGTAVTAVAPADDVVRVELDSGDALTARTVLSTLPLPLLARLAGAPPAVLDAASTLRHRAMVLVYLVFGVDRWTAYDAHYLPEPTTPITRLSEPKAYRDSADDPHGRTVVCAEVPCQVGDPTWTASDEALRDLVVAGIAQQDLPVPDVLGVHVRRLPHAYPVHHRGVEPSLVLLDDWAGDLQRVLTLGRQGLFVHDNSHHALVMAYAAADCLTDDGRIDRAAWRAARDRFATHVVED